MFLKEHLKTRLKDHSTIHYLGYFDHLFCNVDVSLMIDPDFRDDEARVIPADFSPGTQL